MELKPLEDYREALKEAIRREEDAVDFYERSSAVVHQANQKALLKRLAIEEKGHKKILADFADDLTTPPTGYFVSSRYAFNPALKADLTVEDIFKTAIELEEETANFYARLLVYFYKTGHEEVFKKIFDVEMKHKEELQKNFAAFTQQ
jgi:rubrerythrin